MTMIRAAIYARLSKKKPGEDDKSDSVVRQIALAREFAAERGWQVDPSHVYEDDGKSGAEFERRPGLQRLRDAVQGRAPFSVLVVSEQKSLGREQSETSYLIKQLAEAGVEVWSYMSRQCLTPKSALDKMMSSFVGYKDEAGHEDSSKRVTEAHTVKHKNGHVVGGRVFGYRNEDVNAGVDMHGRAIRSHVIRVINPDEARVVQRIFELYDSGLGYKRIARLLTNEGAPAPAPPDRKDGLSPIGKWTPGTVRTVLGRELYKGIAVWNKSKRRAEGYGHIKQKRRPESEWIRVPAEHLRLIDDDLWKRVQARRKDIETKTLRFSSGRIHGRPPRHAPVNLLAGLATCGVCGGGLVVELTGTMKNGRRALYVCARRKLNATFCANELRMPATELNEAVLQAVEEHALSPEAVEQVIALTERDDQQAQQTVLTKERAELDKRLARLLDAIETGGDAASLMARVRELEGKRASLDADLAALRPVPRLAPAVVEGRLAEWRRLLRSSVTQGRAVLQRVLQGRIVFTPDADLGGYTFEAPTRFDKLFTGIAAPIPDYIDRNDHSGKEHITPADTFDADYSALLAQAQRTWKGWRARQDSNLRPLAPEANALSS